LSHYHLHRFHPKANLHAQPRRRSSALSSLRLKVTVPPLTSLEAAVIPTRSPVAAPSETVPPVGATLSVGWLGATSVTPIVKLCELGSVQARTTAAMLY